MIINNNNNNNNKNNKLFLNNRTFKVGFDEISGKFWSSPIWFVS